jgi:hypothetical protein
VGQDPGYWGGDGKPKTNWWIAILFLLAPSAVFLLFVASGSKEIHESHRVTHQIDAERAVIETAPQTRNLNNGSIAELWRSEGRNIFVSSSDEIRKRLLKLRVANDLAGIEQLLSARLVARVPSGTKCRIIDFGVFSMEVRIETGEFAGQSGFVDSEDVH